MVIDFASLPIGTKLAGQLPDVTFLRYRSGAGGVVVDSPSGHVALFNDCPGCEFFSKGANIAFTNLQHSVTLHVGLLPIPGIVLQLDLRMTAYDPGNIAVGTAVATIIAGTGFGTSLTISVPTAIIESVVVEPISDPGFNALIAVHDIILDNAVTGGPDFELEAPVGGTLVQGGPSVDLPLTIRRIGGSSGGILLSVTGLPAGVTANLLPNPAISGAALRLQASIGPSPALSTVTVVGIPTVAAAGPSARTCSIDLATVPPLRVIGPADINIASCVQSGPTHGKVSRDYVVLRAWTVAGPINVALEGLPSDVTGTVNPQTLTFPGSATGQQLTVELTFLAGPPVPDTWASLHLTGQGIDMSLPLLVHGTCPQWNRNFLIRGQFLVENQGTIRPLDGVQVEFFRYRSDWFDDWVGGTYTDANGRFSAELFASRDGDYYARLRLYSPQLQLEDACNSSVWSIDTEHHSNRGGLIDLGSRTILRDGGAGSPRAAVWQGCRDAIVEFENTTAGDVSTYRARGFLNIIVYRGTGPLTWYDEIHWQHAYPTGEPPANPYRVCVHEYGHVIRDKLDGDIWHWHADDIHYVYARHHSNCFGPDAFGIALDEKGFAFHEGWAEYWSQDAYCCANAATNEAIEGTVAYDLHNLAGRTWYDSGGSPHTVGRAGMVRVLARGSNLIHSDTEFRREYAKEFPSAPLGSIGDGCVGPSSAAAIRQQTVYSPLDTGRQRELMLVAIASRERMVRELQERSKAAAGMRRHVLRAAAEECTLVLEELGRQLKLVETGTSPQRELQQRFQLRRAMAEMVVRRRAIQLNALRDAAKDVKPEERRSIERRIELLEHPGIQDHALESLMVLPPIEGDDTLIEHRQQKPDGDQERGDREDRDSENEGGRRHRNR